jgi:hypothetical protein
MYRQEGHDFLAFSDHMKFSTAGRLSTSEFLCIDGIEVHGSAPDGSAVHSIAVGPRRPIKDPDSLEAGLSDAVDAGAFVVLSHPFWCDSSFEVLNDPRYAAIEVYNEICEDISAKGNSAPYWCRVLSTGRPLLAVAVDDAHVNGLYERYARAWVKVMADELSTESIMEGLRSGRFYSSCGPDFLDIQREGNELIVKTSPVRNVWAVGRNGKGSQDRSLPPDRMITEAHIGLGAWHTEDPLDYLRVEIVDAHGRRAWTNTL